MIIVIVLLYLFIPVDTSRQACYNIVKLLWKYEWKFYY